MDGTDGTNGANGTNECVMEVWERDDAENGKLQMADGKGETADGEAQMADGKTTILTEGNEGNEEGGRDGEGDGEKWRVRESVVLKRDGVALTFIPFVFHGPMNSRPDPDRLPLAETT